MSTTQNRPLTWTSPKWASDNRRSAWLPSVRLASGNCPRRIVLCLFYHGTMPFTGLAVDDRGERDGLAWPGLGEVRPAGRSGNIPSRNPPGSDLNEESSRRQRRTGGRAHERPARRRERGGSIEDHFDALNAHDMDDFARVFTPTPASSLSRPRASGGSGLQPRDENVCRFDVGA
jgi:hypothetical protein